MSDKGKLTSKFDKFKTIVKKRQVVKHMVAVSAPLMQDVKRVPTTAAIDTKIFKFRRITNPRQFKLIFGLIVLGLVVLTMTTIALAAHKSQHHSGDKPAKHGSKNSPKGGSDQQQIQIPTLSSGQQTTPRSSAPGPPTFTVYYPVNPPTDLTVDKSSITYSKDSFIFSLKLGGQNAFFVDEQPAGNNFSYQRLKVRLGSPTDIDTPLGPGIFGTISDNFVTAVKTNKNTLIIINCQAIACTVPTKNLIGSLQINTNPTHIR